MTNLRVVRTPEPFTPSSQQEAIYSFLRDGKGHALVVARAGTGKTTTIVQALQYLPPGLSILCCAFNVRIRDVLSELVPPSVRVRTLHQLGRDTMLSWRAYRGFQHDEKDEKGREMAVFALAGSRYERALSEAEEGPERHAAMVRYNETRDAIENGSRLVKATLTKTRPELLALIKEHHLEAPEIADDNELAGYIAVAVKASLDAWPRTDFDDEVWLPVHYGLGLRKFDYVFIDEAQDLTLSQMRLALSAAHDGGRIIAVGDPAQAIYRWRGADKDPFERLQQELNATILPLSVSFRCPKKVVQLAQKYVPDFEAHPSAPDGVVQHIQLADMLMNVRPGDFVLSRTNAPLAQIGLDLSSNKIPTRVVGSSDIGKMLANLVRRSRKKTVEKLLEWLDNYRESEAKRYKDNSSALNYLDDKIATIREFTENETEVTMVAAKIETFFAEQHRAFGKAVILSTVHRLKGDEAPRVFVLEETFFNQRGDPEEEAHIHYVAITRAKQALFRVTGLYEKKGRGGGSRPKE